jgi:transcription initiation factor TFIID subunit 11
MYSPEGSADISDSEITSAISGTTGNAGDGSGVGKKRKRGEKRARGRPPKNAALNDDARSTTGTQKGAASTTGKGDEAPEEEEEEDDDDAAGGRALLDESAALMEEADRRGKEFLLHMPEWQLERHGTWKRAKLKTNNVRTLVNQTLSQSVPANVITVVAAYTKMFAGLIVEGARDVQAEWLAVAEKRPDGEDNHVAKKLSGEGSEAREKARVDGGKAKATEIEGKVEKADEMEVDGEVTVKNEDQSPKADDVPHIDATQPDTGDDATATNGDQHLSNGNGEATPPVLEASMGVRRQIEEVDRGPLLPDHLREALRRYKKAQYGGTVGFTGLSLVGKDNAAARMGGRKLFK